ncbi:hypothetical protein CLOSBL3_11552 [Clostridiaceae bacterium BL-3]|nr:hypothetical protein CLOSBL3_11552 [Clostridiaceae bacterium BL-3]
MEIKIPFYLVSTTAAVKTQVVLNVQTAQIANPAKMRVHQTN